MVSPALNIESANAGLGMYFLRVIRTLNVSTRASC